MEFKHTKGQCEIGMKNNIQTKEAETVNLFQHIETLPKEVQYVIEKHCEMDSFN